MGGLWGYDFVDPSVLQVPRHVIEAFPAVVAHEYCAMPLSIEGNVLLVAVEDPLDFNLRDEMAFVVNREIEFACATRSTLELAIERHYGSRSKS